MTDLLLNPETGLITDPSTGEQWGRFVELNPLAEDADLRQSLSALEPRPPRVILFSGTVADDLFERHPLTWGRPGEAAFESAAEELEAIAAELQICVLFRPHARHVLCDPIRCRSFNEKHAENDRLGVVIDPAAILEPEMLGQVEDHLTRMFEVMGSFARAIFLTPSESRPAGPYDESVIASCVKHERLIRTLASRHARSSIPTIVLPR